MAYNFGFFLAILSVATLAACGGGGGGGGSTAPSSAAPAAPSTSLPSPVPAPLEGPVLVTMTSLNIKAGDVLAQTTSNGTAVAYLKDLLDRFTTTTLSIGPVYANDGNGNTINPTSVRLNLLHRGDSQALARSIGRFGLVPT